jgi:nucleoid DNA-binding protein
MTKKELVNAIAGDAGISITYSGQALNAFVGAFSKAMKKCQRIQLPGSEIPELFIPHRPQRVALLTEVLQTE